MAVRLHADDLGLHPAVDRAIFRAFEAGAIAEASILATGPTFHAAARRARDLGLPLSLHLAIVDTAPLSDPADIPSLIGPGARFPAHYPTVTRRWLLGKLRRGDLRIEIGRQLDVFAEAGLIGPRGLIVDGHQHLHLLPVVFETLLEQAARYQLAAFRLPRRSPAERRRSGFRAVGFAIAEILGHRAATRAARHGVAAVTCWGVLDAGHLTLDRARAVLRSLPSDADGQLLCHPGDDDRALAAAHRWGFAWETELATVLALASPDAQPLVPPSASAVARAGRQDPSLPRAAARWGRLSHWWSTSGLRRRTCSPEIPVRGAKGGNRGSTTGLGRHPHLP